MMKCDCGSNIALSACCAPFITGIQIPDTPEQLMRSRYSAFCQKNADYLVATHYPTQREDNEKFNLESSFEHTVWRGLKIISATNDRVEFVAFCSDSKTGPISQLHEDSNFTFESDQWYYTSGEQLPPIKIGRNDTCICGSGKKYKKCCDI